MPILKIRSYPNLPTHTHTDKYTHTHITEPAGSLHGTFMLHRDPVSVAWSSGNCSSTCLVLTDPAMYSLGILDTSCPRCGKNCLRLFKWFQTIFNMWSSWCFYTQETRARHVPFWEVARRNYQQYLCKGPCDRIHNQHSGFSGFKMFQVQPQT